MNVFQIILLLIGLFLFGGTIFLVLHQIKTWKENPIYYNIAHLVLYFAIFVMSGVSFNFAFM